MTYSKTSLSIKDIQKSFSQAAKQYDELSQVHQKYALRMVEEISVLNANLSNVLDVGCGTGYLSSKLKARFPRAKITGLDFASGMITQAQENYAGIDFKLADASHMPFEGNSFDLVLSNFAYQWMADLTQAFGEAHRVLMPRGQFTATLFGYRTCEELFLSLEHAGVNMASFNRFATISEVQEHLEKAGFASLEVQEEVIKIGFKDLFHLLSWLKAIGANQLSSGKFLGPKALEKASNFCFKNFANQNHILISFEVIKIHATK